VQFDQVFIVNANGGKSGARDSALLDGLPIME
jgi:hypothetical protein